MAKRLSASPRKLATRFEELPNVGPRIAGDFRKLGFKEPADLAGRDPYALYERLIKVTGVHQDPCVLDTFIAVARYVEGGPAKPWWNFTAERKRELARRTK